MNREEKNAYYRAYNKKVRQKIRMRRKLASAFINLRWICFYLQDPKLDGRDLDELGAWPGE